MLVTEERSEIAIMQQYTDADWEEDSYSLFVERSDPQPCPRCGRTGFFGPRAADPDVKFRACRFCGFYQEVGQKPVQFLPVAHSCEEWPECARAPYIWWVPPDQEQYTCPYCGRESAVRGRNIFTPGVLTASPAEDVDHPWGKVPQNRPYAYYIRFWENWDVTRGRVVL